MAELEQEQLFGTPVGERLRVAREEKGLSLDDVARQTRIPIRHLEHIERGEWEALPAVTYSVGFARSYANVVGLDGPAIGAELREQLGGMRGPSTVPAYYEPADPARVPPRSLAILTAIIAALLVVGYLVWRNNALDDPSVDESAITEGPAAPAAAPPANQAATPAAPATGPVVITATEEVWLRVYEPSGTSLYQGILRPGERYEVPAGAAAPMIHTGRPNVLRITVGSTVIPPLGEPEKRVMGVSLKPADLVARLQGAAQPAAPGPQAAPPAGTAPAPAQPPLED
ncbi:MAG TPA: RodZ domain-containing protein [Allosphingosinicella sp.]